MAAARLGVCSWSLQPVSPEDLAAKTSAAGLSTVQVALDSLDSPGWPVHYVLDTLGGAGITIASGMMRTRGEDYSTLETIRCTGGVRADANWEHNLAIARRCGELACKVGVTLVSFHAGFLSPVKSDPLRRVMLDRLRAIIDVFAEFGVRAAFETGQETADTLLGVLQDLQRLTAGVNFDPANMILYDHGDPVESLRKLAPHVLQVHIKDAVRTPTPGTWGSEVPVGTGAVDWPAFFGVMRECQIACDLMIEREAGGRRIEEISAARQLIQRFPLVQ